MNKQKRETLRNLRRALDGQGALGIFGKTTDSAFVEAAGYSGLDFFIVDLEHGLSSLETLQSHIRAAYSSETAPIVRVPSWDSHAISQALDAGAAGVQVPGVSSADQACHVIESAKFHPQGARGMCRYVRDAAYGCQDRHEYFREANEAIVILQVEGTQGIENLDEILSVSGVDVLFVGPYDLSQSLGVPGRVDSDEVQSALISIAERSNARGVAVGAFVDSPEEAVGLFARGLRYIACSVDVGIFGRACKKLTEVVR